MELPSGTRGYCRVKGRDRASCYGLLVRWSTRLRVARALTGHDLLRLEDLGLALPEQVYEAVRWRD